MSCGASAKKMDKKRIKVGREQTTHDAGETIFLNLSIALQSGGS
jgi:hypothetical protein